MAEKEIRLAVGGGGDSRSATKLGNKKKIHKIPPYLRSKEDSDVYDPKVVSIGPYHHGKPQLQLVQGIKRKLLDHLIFKSSSSSQDYEFYFKKMLEVVHRARSCYIMDDDVEEFDDHQFAEMMLLDASFLLNLFLTSIYYGDDVDKALDYYSPMDTTTLFIERDTFLLENQIPLWIIELLFNAIYGNANPPHTWKQLLYMRIQQWIWGHIMYENVDDLEKRVMLQYDDEAPLHQLELYHMLMASRPSSAEAAASTLIISEKEIFDEFGYLFRKSKGIHFRRNYTDDSMWGIKFDSNLLRAEVKLPVFDADTIDQVRLQNIIAYEAFNYARTKFVVGSYINFMKSLIVFPGDVKELREKRIIRSTITEDNEVVKFVHGLNTYDLDNFIIFGNVKQKILKHYNSKTKTWLAEFFHTYFRSAWTAIALFATIFFLFLLFCRLISLLTRVVTS